MSHAEIHFHLLPGIDDGPSSLEEAVALAKEKAKIRKEQEVSLVILPPRKGFFDLLWQRQEEDTVERALPLDIRALLGWMRSWNPDGPMARLPFHLTIR